ncbi:MAG: hypothetical protein AVDCRST_MAG56-3147 [uncultured Cytophagales bacterium]|uniref:Peptidase S8/S53 domain-containing protein n=1 Tax=uncultured Cytophagales bacterium TaxID=158755 RepID=A0A6J4JAR1_9SPHI|nr:MAG: hypothetical protein AVDCRST_MAG56-3147 [uncultured Cytophagales bacterium]
MKMIRHSLLLPFLLLGAALLRAQSLPAPDPSPNARKLAPALALPGSAKGPRTVRVQVAQTDLFGKWLARHLPAVKITARPGGGDIVVATGLDEAGLQKLLGCPWVRYVDVPNRVAREELAQDRLDLTANKITPVHALYPALSGAGLALSVKEQAFDKRDIDFRGRMLNAAAIPNEYSAHATMMASMAAGGGNSAPSGRGVAWQARLAHASFTELLPDDAAALLAAGISVQNHSYGVGIENYYGIEAHEYDQSTFRNPVLLHVFSSGNAGRDTSKTGPYAGIPGYATLTGQFKMAKNTLSVGAVDRTGGAVGISSRGPAYDGRVKPELAALGEAGTSDAAALVSGISLLVQQAYRDQRGTLPPAALVKAALLNSADDAGRPEVDFETGFGNADALGAVRTVLEGRFFVDSLAQGAERVYTVRVPAGGYRLKGTLVWHDPEAAPNAARALVNDLDLQLRSPATGTRWRPWTLSPFPHPDSLARPARRGEDHLNNAEQVTLTMPAPGVYEFRVRGFRVAAGRQAYSLAYEIEPPFAWVYPVRGTVLTTGTPSPVRWEWPRPDSSARLEYRVIGSEEWLPAGEEDGLPQSPFGWTPPDTAARMQLRLVSETGTFASDTFAVAPALTLREGYRCGEELMLYWSPAPGASGYQLYRLGDQYMEPLLTTTDTLVTLNPGRDSVYYAVAPLFGGTAGPRGNTAVSTRAASACYVVSLLPRQLVTDTVLLDLEVGTTYQLRSVQLERWTNGRFETVQSVSPVNALTMTFADPMPARGVNRYRVRIENVRNEIYYSGEESVFYVRQDQIMVFPNPVRGGQPVNVAGEWGAAPDTYYRLYDHLGKLLFERWETGTLHQIPTHGLRKGIYLLEARTGSAPPAFSRFVVL